MWEIKCVQAGEEEKLLKDGWEPFAISPHLISYEFYNEMLREWETRYQTTDYTYLKRSTDAVLIRELAGKSPAKVDNTTGKG